MSQYRADSRVESLALFGGTAAIAMSIGLAISLEMRDEGFNPMNAFTLIAAVGAGILAIRAANS